MPASQPRRRRSKVKAAGRIDMAHPTSRLWSIRSPISSRQYWLLALLGLAVPLAGWWGVAALELARTGKAEMSQDETFGPLMLRGLRK